MKRKRARSDGGLVSAILSLCAAMGIEADRRNSGELLVERKGRTYMVKLCKAGTFDIFGYAPRCKLSASTIFHPGEFEMRLTKPFEMECKTTTGKARDAQLARAKLLTKLGVPWCYARSIGQAKAFLEGLIG